MKKNEELTRISKLIKEMIDEEVVERIRLEEKFQEKFDFLKTEIEIMLDNSSSDLNYYKDNNFTINAAEAEGFRRALMMLKDYAENI